MRAAESPIASTIANEIRERFEDHADTSSAAGKRVSTSLVKNMAARAIGPHRLQPDRSGCLRTDLMLTDRTEKPGIRLVVPTY
jgi:hypothetical protein